MGPETPGELRRNLPLSVLGVRGVGGRGGGRPAAYDQRGTHLLPLEEQQRVLERPAGEGLRQVSTPEPLCPQFV